MNESFERLNDSDLRAELQALRKKVEELETMQRQNAAARRPWFSAGSISKLLLVAGFFVLTVGLLAAADDSKALFINPQGYVGINQTKPEASLDVNGNTLVRGQLGIGAAKPAAPLDVNGNAIVRGQIGIGTAAPQSIAEIRKDAPGAPGPVLSISNLGGGPATSAAIDFRTYAHATPEARIQVVDGNYSDDLLFQNKIQGSENNNLKTNLKIGSDGVVTIPGSLKVDGKTDLGIYTNPGYPDKADYWDIACNSGDVALSGGAWVGPGNVLRESRPTSTDNWRVACTRILGSGRAENVQCVQAFVVCAGHAK